MFEVSGKGSAGFANLMVNIDQLGRSFWAFNIPLWGKTTHPLKPILQ
jgi:hypothetical protein